MTAPRLALAGGEPPGPPPLGFLIVIVGAQPGRKFDLRLGTLTIGQGEERDVCLPDETLSRRHADVIVDDDGVWIADRNSISGTWVNDANVDRARLHDGDIVRLGRTILKYVCVRDLEQAYYEEIYRMSTLDGLTQLYNQRYFAETLNRAFVEARRAELPLALLLLEIDEVDQVDARDVLRPLAKTVTQYVRPPTIIARHDGARIVVLFQRTDHDEVMRMAETLREAVGNAALGVTISVGVAELDASFADGEALLQHADACVRGAKRSGGNRIVSTPAP